MRSHPIRSNTEMRVQSIAGETPLRVTTTEAHGLKTGEVVMLKNLSLEELEAGVAEGFAITVISPTEFTLNGTVYSGITEENLAINPDTTVATLSSATRTYAADTELRGETVVLSPDTKHSDTGTIVVEAEQDPTDEGFAVTVYLEGRPSPQSDWLTITTIDEGDTWTQGDSKWLASATSLELYPQMRIRVGEAAGSVNEVQAWLIT